MELWWAPASTVVRVLAHAEVEALATAGAGAHEADLYVSLEPCSHFGRTPACTQLIIDAGISRVFYAQDDPTSEAGGGAGVLRNAGLEVVGGFDSALSSALNREWNHRMVTGMPFVTWKFAQSLDGRVAAAIGQRTVDQRDASHGVSSTNCAARVGAVMVGTETFLVDSPSLAAREVDGSRESEPATAGGHGHARRRPEGVRALGNSRSRGCPCRLSGAGVSTISC